METLTRGSYTAIWHIHRPQKPGIPPYCQMLKFSPCPVGTLLHFILHYRPGPRNIKADNLTTIPFRHIDGYPGNDPATFLFPQCFHMEARWTDCFFTLAPHPREVFKWPHICSTTTLNPVNHLGSILFLTMCFETIGDLFTNTLTQLT